MLTFSMFWWGPRRENNIWVGSELRVEKNFNETKCSPFGYQIERFTVEEVALGWGGHIAPLIVIS